MRISPLLEHWQPTWKFVQGINQQKGLGPVLFRIRLISLSLPLVALLGGLIAIQNLTKTNQPLDVSS